MVMILVAVLVGHHQNKALKLVTNAQVAKELAGVYFRSLSIQKAIRQTPDQLRDFTFSIALRSGVYFSHLSLPQPTDGSEILSQTHEIAFSEVSGQFLGGSLVVSEKWRNEMIAMNKQFSAVGAKRFSKN